MAYSPLLTDAEMIQISFWFLVGMGLLGLVIDGIKKVWLYARKSRKPGNLPETEVTGNPEDPANA